MIGCAEISVAVCAYKFYSSNKSKIKNMVKLDILFMFSADDEILMRRQLSNINSRPNEVIVCHLVQIRNLYEDNFSSLTNDIYRYEYNICMKT